MGKPWLRKFWQLVQGHKAKDLKMSLYGWYLAPLGLQYLCIHCPRDHGDPRSSLFCCFEGLIYNYSQREVRLWKWSKEQSSSMGSGKLLPLKGVIHICLGHGGQRYLWTGGSLGRAESFLKWLLSESLRPYWWSDWVTCGMRKARLVQQET